jgi:hypothetical protein
VYALPLETGGPLSRKATETPRDNFLFIEELLKCSRHYYTPDSFISVDNENICGMKLLRTEDQLLEELLDLAGEKGVALSGRALARCFADRVRLKRGPRTPSDIQQTQQMAKRLKCLPLPDDLSSTLPCGQELNVDFVSQLKDRLDAWYDGRAFPQKDLEAQLVSQKLSTPPCIALEDVDIFMDGGIVLYMCKNCHRPVLESRIYEHIIRCCPERWISSLNECAKQMMNIAGQLARMPVENEQHGFLISREFPELYFSQLLDEEDGTGKTRFGRHVKRVGRLYDAKLLFAHGLESAKASISEDKPENQSPLTEPDMGFFRNSRAFLSSRFGNSPSFFEGGSKNHLNNVFTEPAKCRAFHRKYFWPRLPSTVRLSGTEGETVPDRFDPLARLLYLNMSWEKIVQVALPPIMKRRSANTKNQTQAVKEQLSTKEELSPASTNTIAHALLRVQNKRPAGCSWLVDLRHLPQSKTGNGVFHGQSFFFQPGTFWTDSRRGAFVNNTQTMPNWHKSQDAAQSLTLSPHRIGTIHSSTSSQRQGSAAPGPFVAVRTEQSRLAAAERSGSAGQPDKNTEQRHISYQNPIEMKSQLASEHSQSLQRNRTHPGLSVHRAHQLREANHEGFRQPVHRELVEWLRRDPFFLQMLDAARERVYALPNLTPDRQQQALATLERRLMFERLRAIAQAVIFAREMPLNSRARISATSLLSTLRPLNDAQRSALGEFVRQLVATQRSAGQGSRHTEQTDEPLAGDMPLQNSDASGPPFARIQQQVRDVSQLQRNHGSAEPREKFRGAGAVSMNSSQGTPDRQRSDADVLAAIDRALGIPTDH